MNKIDINERFNNIHYRILAMDLGKSYGATIHLSGNLAESSLEEMLANALWQLSNRMLEEIDLDQGEG